MSTKASKAIDSGWIDISTAKVTAKVDGFEMVDFEMIDLDAKEQAVEMPKKPRIIKSVESLRRPPDDQINTRQGTLLYVVEQ